MALENAYASESTRRFAPVISPMGLTGLLDAPLDPSTWRLQDAQSLAWRVETAMLMWMFLMDPPFLSGVRSTTQRTIGDA